MDDMYCLGLITARGGSKGVPRKNLREVAGKPLIAWTIEAALRSRCLNRVVVSTDDREIAAVAQAFGADVPFLRPRELAQDHTSHLDVALHALQTLQDQLGRTIEYLVTLQPTSPLRESEDIDGAVELANRHSANAVIGVCESESHPYLMQQLDDRSCLTPYFQTHLTYLRRQDLPRAFRINGAVYVHRVRPLQESRIWFPPEVAGYIMPGERSLDVDSEHDLRIVDYLLRSSRRVLRAA